MTLSLHGICSKQVQPRKQLSVVAMLVIHGLCSELGCSSRTLQLQCDRAAKHMKMLWTVFMLTMAGQQHGKKLSCRRCQGGSAFLLPLLTGDDALAGKA